jgi:capsule polysaccharide modification protein KpsS
MAKKARSTAVDRRKDLQNVVIWSKEHGVDEISVVALLKEIAITCIEEGYDSESVCMKADEGKVTLNQRFPAVAVSALTQISRIMIGVHKELDKEPPADPVINLYIGKQRLEEVLEETEEDG